MVRGALIDCMAGQLLYVEVRLGAWEVENACARVGTIVQVKNVLFEEQVVDDELNVAHVWSWLDEIVKLTEALSIGANSVVIASLASVATAGLATRFASQIAASAIDISELIVATFGNAFLASSVGTKVKVIKTIFACLTIASSFTDFAIVNTVLTFIGSLVQIFTIWTGDIRWRIWYAAWWCTGILSIGWLHEDICAFASNAVIWSTEAVSTGGAALLCALIFVTLAATHLTGLALLEAIGEDGAFWTVQRTSAWGAFSNEKL
jgi:hypothetical protein